MKEKQILLIEDDIRLGELYVELFQRAGVVVHWYCRARLQDGNLVLVNDRGQEFALDKDNCKGAIVDGRLSFSALSGLEITKHLVSVGVPVAAFSGARFLNEQMVQAGATATIDKLDIIAEVLEGRFVCPFDQA